MFYQVLQMNGKERTKFILIFKYSFINNDVILYYTSDEDLLNKRAVILGGGHRDYGKVAYKAGLTERNWKWRG